MSEAGETKDTATTQSSDKDTEFDESRTFIYSSILSGILLALSLFLMDILLVQAGTDTVAILGFDVHFTVISSAFYITSLIAGLFVGKARLEDSSLIVITFGGSWVLSMFVAGVLGLELSWLITAIAVLAFLLGGIGLGMYRYLQGEKGIDGMFQIVLLACTALNLLYFSLGG